MDISRKTELPNKPEGMFWSDFLDGYMDLVCAYYWSFGLKATARFTQCSESTLLQTIDRWGAWAPQGYRRDPGDTELATNPPRLTESEVEGGASMIIGQPHLNYCEPCTNGFSSDLTPVGEIVQDRVGQPRQYAFFQCPRCGHLWQRISTTNISDFAQANVVIYSRLSQPYAIRTDITVFKDSLKSRD